VAERVNVDLVGTKEAAAIYGVRPSNFVRDWASRQDFPEPVATLARGRLWAREAVVDYREQQRGDVRWPARRPLKLSPDAERWLPIIKRRIVKRFRPERIVVFGSQARGDATPDSDIDLLVVVADGRDRRQLLRSIRMALADVVVSKDIFVTTPGHAARYGDVIGTLVEPALREGVTIYARS
jgi:predicted nucleotidyltransferase